MRQQVNQKVTHLRSFLVVASIALPLMFALGAVVGCGGDTDTKSASTGIPPAPEEDEPTGPPPDLSRPFVDGVRSTLSSARTQLPFAPVVPAGIGELTDVYLHADVTDVADQALGLLFDSAQFGRFTVIQDLTTQVESDLEALSRCEPSDGCEGTWEVVDLPRGMRGLYIGGPTVHSVILIADGRRINILGLASDLPKEGVVTIARVFVAMLQTSA